MDIFEHIEPLNVFSLHLNKRECRRIHQRTVEIVSLLRGKDYLSEEEKYALDMARDTMVQSARTYCTIDEHLKKFLN